MSRLERICIVKQGWFNENVSWLLVLFFVSGLEGKNLWFTLWFLLPLPRSAQCCLRCMILVTTNVSEVFYRCTNRVGLEILAAIASIGAVLFTMYDPGNDKCKLSLLSMYDRVGLENDVWKKRLVVGVPVVFWLGTSPGWGHCVKLLDKSQVTSWFHSLSSRRRGKVQIGTNSGITGSKYWSKWQTA